MIHIYFPGWFIFIFLDDSYLFSSPLQSAPVSKWQCQILNSPIPLEHGPFENKLLPKWALATYLGIKHTCWKCWEVLNGTSLHPAEGLFDFTPGTLLGVVIYFLWSNCSNQESICTTPSSSFILSLPLLLNLSISRESAWPIMNSMASLSFSCLIDHAIPHHCYFVSGKFNWNIFRIENCRLGQIIIVDVILKVLSVLSQLIGRKREDYFNFFRFLGEPFNNYDKSYFRIFSWLINSMFQLKNWNFAFKQPTIWRSAIV